MTIPLIILVGAARRYGVFDAKEGEIAFEHPSDLACDEGLLLTITWDGLHERHLQPLGEMQRERDNSRKHLVLRMHRR
eukprot:1699730-Amphidinium_carterae.1